ncbi:hypothetical protein CY34DRAFT_11482 [Suillus luteus UH-Slu-Lm8-n1]|uniref:Uncharacterized protein n=1 Tax=Suillus luteus UH-Slu-Lm8-n1 TaxID=930992 RepID=A0A0D0BKK3_9AGAM|nr:hypothetical protein CY34DRAFT_11482 [Suillus luteus UH-Slu-Lm8-n1]
MNLHRQLIEAYPLMSNTPLGVPQPAPHGQFLDQGSPPYIRTTGSMAEGTDHHLGQLPQELPYYGIYGSATYKPRTQNFLPQYAANSRNQSWTAPQDPQVKSSPPEVADPRLGLNPRALLPYNTFGSGITELGAQESLSQHSTYSEEQNLSTPYELWGSQSEVADPRLGQSAQELLPNGNFGFTSYEPEVQVELSKSVTHLEGQTWPALFDPRVTETLPEEADPHLGQQPQELFPYDNESASYVPGAHGILPQHSSSSEEQTLLGQRHHLSLPPPMVQGHQNRVMCTQPGCGVILNKENLTRHNNEVHERKIRARCDRCGREFTRPYLKREHVRQARCRKR